MRKLKTEFDMRYRPKRENYPRGVFGDIDYQERLERYCTYLENKNKALTQVVERSKRLVCDTCKGRGLLAFEEEDMICSNCFGTGKAK